MDRNFLNESTKFIPYGRQTILEDDIEEVIKVLRSSYLTQGPVVNEFEEKLSKKLEVPYAVTLNSATSALHIACLSLGLREGDILWTSPITFVASANCARYCGASVDFVDIDPITGLMSLSALEKKLKAAKKNNSLPKIVVPVHLSGASCDMKKIFDLSKKYGFLIIEDASHAIGGKYFNKYVGSCQYSEISVFSLHPVKIITSGEGGVATTKNITLAEKIKELRSHGITKDFTKFVLPEKELWKYEQQDLGFNYRLTDIHAALGMSQLKRLDKVVEERNNLLENYKELSKGFSFQFLKIPENVYSSVHLAIIKLDKKGKKFHRQVFEGMRAAGVGVQIHYIPVHLQPYYQKQGFHFGQFPHAEAYSTNVITLPLYPGLTFRDQEYIINKLIFLMEEFN
tara:strand:- start:853 stop:2049 length:1197 start_codon:yes stop_codon:yes gene_type:complete